MMSVHSGCNFIIKLLICTHYLLLSLLNYKILFDLFLIFFTVWSLVFYVIFLICSVFYSDHFYAVSSAWSVLRFGYFSLIYFVFFYLLCYRLNMLFLCDQSTLIWSFAPFLSWCGLFNLVSSLWSIFFDVVCWVHFDLLTLACFLLHALFWFICSHWSHWFLCFRLSFFETLLVHQNLITCRK